MLKSVENLNINLSQLDKKPLQAFLEMQMCTWKVIIYPAKHIEIQILADQHGIMVHLESVIAHFKEKIKKSLKKLQVLLFLLNLEEIWGEEAVKLLKQ